MTVQCPFIAKVNCIVIYYCVELFDSNITKVNCIVIYNCLVFFGSNILQISCTAVVPALCVSFIVFFCNAVVHSRPSVSTLRDYRQDSADVRFQSVQVSSLLCVLGAGIAQWLERRTRDQKVPGSSPGKSGRRSFTSRVNFLCRLLFWYPFHPRVTAVVRKRSRSFCHKCRWQVTAKHAYTSRMWLCMK